MDNPTEAGQMNSEEWALMLDALSDIDNIDYIFFRPFNRNIQEFLI